MKVVALRSFFSEDLSYIRNKLDDGIEFIVPEDFSESTLLKTTEDADVLFGTGFTDKIISNCKHLKFIQVPWTGVDNLDFELLTRHQITICNSHSNAGIVAEHAISLMLDGAKKLSYHDQLMRQGEWNRPSKSENSRLSPFSKKVFGSNVAIVGFGAIGHKIAQYLKGFECKITCYNRNGKGDDDHLYYTTLDANKDNMHEHDFIFLSLALTANTKNIVDDSFLNGLHKQAVLVNVSRGEIINEDHLYKFLLNNKEFVACLDTWYQYPKADKPKIYPSIRNEFHLLSNIVMSPHRAGMVFGALPHLDDAITNLNRYKSGKELLNVISLKNRY